MMLIGFAGLRHTSVRIHIRKFSSEVPCLVTGSWLAGQLENQKWHNYMRVLDATWDLPKFKRNFKEEHLKLRIPGSKYFSIDECSDRSSSLPHMLPPASQFEDYVSHLGIGNDHHVVIYDNSATYGLFSAPRVWWMFRTFGHNRVSVLNGGMPKWISDGFPIVSGPYANLEILPGASESFKSRYRPELVRDLEFMKKNVIRHDPVQVMDARARGRFLGTQPEPEPSILSGHMPQSTNVPFMGLLTTDGKEKVLKSKDDIVSYITSCGIDLAKDMVASCGSGVTGAVNIFALYYCTGKEVPLYDGSWTEWQTRTPLEMQVRAS